MRLIMIEILFNKIKTSLNKTQLVMQDYIDIAENLKLK